MSTNLACTKPDTAKQAAVGSGLGLPRYATHTHTHTHSNANRTQKCSRKGRVFGKDKNGLMKTIAGAVRQHPIHQVMMAHMDQLDHAVPGVCRLCLPARLHHGMLLR